jgi:hypothetical protein
VIVRGLFGNMKSKCYLDESENNSATENSDSVAEAIPSATYYSLVTRDKRHLFHLSTCNDTQDVFTSELYHRMFVINIFNVRRDRANGDCIRELCRNPNGCVCIVDFVLLEDIEAVHVFATRMKAKALIVTQELKTVASIPVFVVSAETLNKMKSSCNDYFVSIQEMAQPLVSGEFSLVPLGFDNLTDTKVNVDCDLAGLSSGNVENPFSLVDVTANHPLNFDHKNSSIVRSIVYCICNLATFQWFLSVLSFSIFSGL